MPRATFGRKTIGNFEKSKIKLEDTTVLLKEAKEKIKFKGEEIQIQSLEKYDFQVHKLLFLQPEVK